MHGTFHMKDKVNSLHLTNCLLQEKTAIIQDAKMFPSQEIRCAARNTYTLSPKYLANTHLI